MVAQKFVGAARDLRTPQSPAAVLVPALRHGYDVSENSSDYRLAAFADWQDKVIRTFAIFAAARWTKIVGLTLCWTQLSPRLGFDHDGFVART